MVVEIPAGTNEKLEYSADETIFSSIGEDGNQRLVQYLPYLGNYGFVPSTLMQRDFGGDGDAVDVLLISEFLETGTVLEVLPIAALVLTDMGETDTKIIAIPASDKLRIIDVDTHKELLENYPSVLQLIEIWFLNYKGDTFMEYISWEDEAYANQLIRRSTLIR